MSFGCFLVRDDEPAMVETGLNGFFEMVHGAVRRRIDPVRFRYIFTPHFEMEECGSFTMSSMMIAGLQGGTSIAVV